MPALHTSNDPPKIDRRRNMLGLDGILLTQVDSGEMTSGVFLRFS
jgi:hypothetical protein